MKNIYTSILLIFISFSGFSQWENLNPISYTNELKCIKFVNANIGYAVGRYGRIIKTSDGGINWISQTSGTSIDLNSVYFTDINNGYAVGYGGTILKTTNGGVNWISQVSGTTSALVSVCFTDQNTGYVIGQSMYVIKTTDGGINWTSLSYGTGGIYSTILFTDANTGYIADNSVGKTTNGGNTWISTGLQSIRSAFFLDNNLGYAVGLTGVIYKTTNGGNNWITQTSGTTSDLYSVFFTDAETGFAVGQYGAILKTTNGGVNWNPQLSGTDSYLYSVFFTGTNTGYAVGEYGVILYTSNGGMNWINQSLCITMNDLFSLYFSNTNTGYVVGTSGTIIKTTNGGINWITQVSGTANTLSSVFFIDMEIGYAAGNNGSILKTTNGGSNWISQSSNSNNWLSSISFPVRDTGYVLDGQGRAILKTTNGGINWNSQTTGYTNSYLNSICFTDVDNGYAVGNSGIILKTTNGGTNWSLVFNAGYFLNLSSVYFLNSDTGFVAGEYYNGSTINSAVLWTHNAGLSWTGDICDEPSHCHSVFFPSVNIGYIAGSGGIRKTTNGGSDWIRQTVNLISELYSVFMIDSITGYAVGMDGTILKTTNGGLSVPGQPVIPYGPIEFCRNTLQTTYTTTGVYGATSYKWEVNPISAGIITGNWLTGTMDWNTTFTGVAQITVKGHNSIGDGLSSLPLAVTVYDIPPTPIISRHFSELISSAPSGNQWYRNGYYIPGATNQLLTCTMNGSYTVIVTQYGCSSVPSDSMVIDNIEISEKNGFSIYPNPAQDELILNLGYYNKQTDLFLFIYNIQGQIILQQILKQNNTEIDISQLQQGVYIAMIRLGDGSEVQEKFVVIK